MSNACTHDRGGEPPDDPPSPVSSEGVGKVLSGPPGPELLTALISLAPQDLTAGERVEVVAAWRRVIAFCTSGQLDAVAELDRSMPKPQRFPDSLRPAADELSPALAIAPASASRLVGLARRLDRDLPATADALAEGRMDLAQVRLVAAVTKDVPLPSVVTALEGLAVQHAPRKTVAQLRHLLEAEASRRVSDWAARRCAAGRDQRDVQLVPSPLPGCRRVIADLPLVDATAVWMAVNSVAAAHASAHADAPGDAPGRTPATSAPFPSCGLTRSPPC